MSVIFFIEKNDQNKCTTLFSFCETVGNGRQASHHHRFNYFV